MAIEDQVPPRAGSGRKITLVFDPESEEKEDTGVRSSPRTSPHRFGHLGSSLDILGHLGEILGQI